MKKIILSTFLFLMTVVVIAQDYTTPNTGVVWTLDDIAAASPTTITISGNDYSLLGNLTIAENDTVIIDSDLTLSIAAGKRVTVFGTFTISANAVTITAIDSANPYDGFRFEQDSQIDLQNATIEYGGGLRVLTETFSIDNCTLTNNVSGTTSSAVIQLSRGIVQITNNTISFNENPAIGSAANSNVSGLISNNIIEGNNTANANRPQINMGPTSGSEPLQIVNNTIIGDPTNTKAGGIAIANFVGSTVNVLIDGNTIQNNRYGITILGNVDSAMISNNVIEDNNIEGDPMLGGSGINLNASSVGTAVVVTANEIRRNLWGITVQGDATLNLGDDANNPGQNIFAENENGGQVFALYNNTPHPISAKNNCWIEGQQSTEQQVEDVIFHSVDDPNLGEVTFDPFLCGVLGVADVNIENFSFYPNPVKNELNFNNIFSFSTVEIYGVQGNLVVSKTVSEGQNTLPINLPAGVYFVNFSNDAQTITKKLIVQ
jgi:parallel beta-helix repeat protein